MIDVTSNPSEAVEHALNTFGNDILRLAFSYMKSREDAEDMVQEVLIRFMQSAKAFENEQHMKAWLLQVCANGCKDRLRSASRRRETAMPEGYEPAGQEEIYEGDSEILQQVMRLPEKYRSVIHLYYYEEYSTKEIADILEKKETTVRSLLKRGRDKLKDYMKGDGR
jgi:RNA polymerase sigma-70 factor (ECF subfamily)